MNFPSTLCFSQFSVFSPHRIEITTTTASTTTTAIVTATMTQRTTLFLSYSPSVPVRLVVVVAFLLILALGAVVNKTISTGGFCKTQLHQNCLQRAPLRPLLKLGVMIMQHPRHVNVITNLS